MIDLEPFLEAPFEEASNLSFEALLGLGVALLAAVAVLGRSRVTMAAVAVYLLLIPGYVGYRIRIWEGADGGECDDEADDEANSDDGTGDDGADGETGESTAAGGGERDAAPASGAGESAPDADSAGDETRAN